MRAAIAAGACAALCACAHVRAPDDPVLADLDAGYAALRGGDHPRARDLLARALARFDDLALDGSVVAHALASDPKKPYRGRPHERVLTALLVAALDAESGRCDMAPASLKNARYLAAQAATGAETPLPLADALARACETRTALTLELVGAGPTLAAAGAHGQDLVVSAGGGDEVWAHITIAGAAPPIGDRARVDAWTSTAELARAAPRRFADVLAVRARQKDDAERASRAQLEAGLDDVERALADASLGGDRTATPSSGTASSGTALSGTASSGTALSGAAVQAGARLGLGLAMGAAGAALDARVDVRYVRGLPERVRVVGVDVASAPR